MAEIEFIKSLYNNYIPKNEENDGEEEDILNEEFIKEALDGKDLQEYSRKIQQELKETEQELILDLSMNFKKLLELYHQIKDCHDDLNGISRNLSGYQQTLESISTEIQKLQEQSINLSKKLKNRREMQAKTNLNLDGILISSELLKKIFQGEVNEFFLQDLQELNRKMRFVKELKSRNISALKDVGPVLERLRLKASEKCRDFLLKKMEQIKSTSTNIGVLQVNVLLKYKELYSFLTERYVDVAIEVRQSYVGLGLNYYQTLFERYIKGLSKLQVVINFIYSLDEYCG